MSEWGGPVQESVDPSGFGWLLEEMRRLKTRVAELETRNPLENASIGKGGLRVYDGGGIDIEDGGRFRVRHPDDLGGDDAVYAGDIYDQDTGAYLGTGLMVEQPDGTDILMARTDVATGGTTVYLKDRNGWNVVETDPVRGGLALPWIPFVMAPAPVLSWENTTSTAFTTLYTGRARRVSPRAGVSFSGSCGGGTSGELRLLRDGVQVGDTLPIPAATAASSYVIFDLLDPLQGATSNIDLQARVTSGAGPVYAKVNWAEGRS